MARPERNNVDYFPFMCEDGNKMFYIEETYGNDGFATFVKLLRELAKTNYHYLDLSKPTTQMFLSAKCKVNKETLLSIIKDLVDLGKFDKMLWEENSIVWCQDFTDSIQDAYIKRKNKCITYSHLLQLLTSLGVRKPSKCTINSTDKPQSIVKESKEDKTILNEIKNNNDLFYTDLFNSQQWLEKVSMNNKNNFNLVQVKQKLLEFKNDLDLRFDIKVNKNEFASHFVRWLNQQKNTKTNVKPYFDSPA